MEFINTITGEIIDLPRHMTNQRRTVRRSRTYKQRRAGAHFPKAMRALALIGTFAVVLVMWGSR